MANGDQLIFQRHQRDHVGRADVTVQLYYTRHEQIMAVADRVYRKIINPYFRQVPDRIFYRLEDLSQSCLIAPRSPAVMRLSYSP